MMDWLSWSNFFYLVGIVIAGGATKYKNIVKEVKEVAKELELAYEDGKLSKDEKEKIMKQCLDVLKAIINLKWRIF